MGAFIIKLIENNPSIVFLAVSALVGVGIWVGRVNSDRDAFKRFMEEVREDIKKIFERLPAKTATDQSPLKLTSLGEEISGELAASDWAKETAPAIAFEVAGKHPYEVQEFCLEYVKGNVLSENMQEKVKTSAFEHGLNKEQVLRVLAVELRDCLLAD